MTAPEPSVDSVAEDLIGWLEVGPRTTRVVSHRSILVDRPLPSPWFATANRLRYAPGQADLAIDEVRRWFAGRGRAAFCWVLGVTTAPAGLANRLLARGATFDETLTAMVLDTPPPSGPSDVRTTAVETLEDYATVLEIQAAAFGFSDAGPDREARLEAARADWDYWSSEPGRSYLLAWVDGEPVAMAGMARTVHGPLALSGGATLPAARGRGAYRALVRARWELAVRDGPPSFVVQASAMSRPILAGVGFRAVSEVVVLADHADPPADTRPNTAGPGALPA